QLIPAVGEGGRRRKVPVPVASHDDRGAKDCRAGAERDNVAGDAGSRYDRLRRGRVGPASGGDGDRRRRRGGRLCPRKKESGPPIRGEIESSASQRGRLEVETCG